ncbi:MAG: hypothetical protein WBL98_21670, partial [Pseudolabrys sp.]
KPGMTRSWLRAVANFTAHAPRKRAFFRIKDLDPRFRGDERECGDEMTIRVSLIAALIDFLSWPGLSRPSTSLLSDVQRRGCPA